MSAGTPQIQLKVTPEQLVLGLRAHMQRAAAAPITSLSTDTRNVTPGTLFLALSGERFDGHSFVGEAARSGAAAVVISRAKLSCADALPASVGIFVVDDPLSALQSLAAWYRGTLSAKVIGITGSVGKTTTKELLAAALIADVGEAAVLKTEGNLNSQIGLPLMVLMARPEHKYVVLEMGLSQFQEMHRLSMIAQPDVATITSVAEAHLEFLGDLDGVARAKSEIFDGLAPAGIAVLPDWDARLVNVAASLEARLGQDRVCMVGASQGAAVRILRSVKQRVTLEVQGRELEMEVPLIGEHHTRNAALALACAIVAGADPERAARGIVDAKVPGGRSRLATEIKGFTVIDDSYNANPASMKAALSSLSLVSGGRRVAILGDMKELGVDSKQDHYQVGAFAARSVELLLAYGQDATEFVRGAQEAGLAAAVLLDASIEVAVEKVRSLVQPNDRILVKGSRSMKMERFLAALS